MKKLVFLVASALLSGATMVANATQSVFHKKSYETQIEQLQNELLVLTPTSTDLQFDLSHGSHSSHYSHGSHGSHSSHSSHSSHYSSR